MPVAVEPSLSFVVGAGWWFAHRAMQEYECVEHDGRRALAVTLVRSVGWMSRRDLVTRGVGAGPDMETPDAQCLGEHVFEFRFGLCAASSTAERLRLARMQARALRKPPLKLRGTVNHAMPNVDIGTDDVETSSVRRIGDMLELRVWNPTGETQRLALSANEWVAVRADGATCDRAVHEVPAYSMHTLRQRVAMKTL
ncbi:MAG: hypothetical protein ACRDAM_13660 [Casimicrobium sp.]